MHVYSFDVISAAHPFPILKRIWDGNGTKFWSWTPKEMKYLTMVIFFTQICKIVEELELEQQFNGEAEYRSPPNQTCWDLVLSWPFSAFEWRQMGAEMVLRGKEWHKPNMVKWTCLTITKPFSQSPHTLHLFILMPLWLCITICFAVYMCFVFYAWE